MNENEKIANGIYFEGMTSIRAVLKGFELGVNTRKIKKIYFDKDSVKSKYRELSYLKKMSELHSFEIEYIQREVLDSMSVGTTHGGILAECTDREFRDTLPSSLDDKKFFVMLEGTVCEIVCEYSDLAMLQKLIEAAEGEIKNTEYTDKITINFVLKNEFCDSFKEKLRETFSARLILEEKEKILLPFLKK